MKKYLLVIMTTISALLLMSVMLVFMLNRDVEAESLFLTTGDNPDGQSAFLMDPDVAYEAGTGNDKEGYFMIPLEAGIGEKDVKITEDPDNMSTLITIPITDPEFYYMNNLSGSREHINAVEFNTNGKEVLLEIKTDEVTAAKTMFEEGSLYIRFDTPDEVYKRVVFIDAGHGGEDNGTEAYGIFEKDITLGVAEKIEIPEDTGLGVYFSRSADEMLTGRERTQAAKAVNAEYIISLHTNADKDTRITRGVEISYDDPSVKDMANELAREFEKIDGVYSVELKDGLELEVFKDSEAPVILIRLGYMTNRTEAELLDKDGFQTSAAKAIEKVIFK